MKQRKHQRIRLSNHSNNEFLHKNSCSSPVLFFQPPSANNPGQLQPSKINWLLRLSRSSPNTTPDIEIVRQLWHLAMIIKLHYLENSFRYYWCRIIQIYARKSFAVDKNLQ